MAKRLTPDEWATLERDFHKWCIESNDISVQGFYRSLNKPKVSQSAVEKRAKAKEWVQKAQDHVNREELPKIKKEKEDLERKAEAQEKALTTIEIGRQESPLPDSTPEAVRQVIKYVQDGLGFNVLGYTKHAKIVNCHIDSVLAMQDMDLLDDNGKQVFNKEGKSIKMQVDLMAAQTTKILVDSLATYHKLMKNSVKGSKETFEALFSIEDQAVNQLVMYKEQAKVKGKDTGDNKKRAENQKTIDEWHAKPDRERKYKGQDGTRQTNRHN